MPDPSRNRDQIDRLLLEGWKEGKKECFDELYQYYVGPIYRFIYHMVQQKETVEDLTQEVFIKLYHNAALYRPTGSFSSWLYQIARNLTISYFRREKSAQHTVSFDMASPEGVR